MISRSMKIPLLCGGFAFLLRCGIWLTAVTTPLGKMHCVPGLDMETLLTFSRWGNPGATAPLFVPHRMLIALLAWACGPENCVPWLLLVQSLMGTAGAILAADCARRLWRKDAAALIAGLGFAAYGPFLLYECSVLQEAVLLNGLVLTFWLLVVFRDGKRKILPAVLTGLSAGFFTCGRPAGVLFALTLPFTAAFLAPEGKKRLSGIAAAAGIFAVWGIAAGFNWYFSGTWSPFFHVLPYAVAVNTGNPAAEVSAGTVLASLWRMLGRIPLLFTPWETPENLNWYFFRDQFPSWKFLLGPGLVLPLGVGALVWFAASRKHWKSGWLLLLPLLTLAPLLAVREPIGRYRLLLIPYLLILIAGCAVNGIPANREARRLWRGRIPEIFGGIVMLALLLTQSADQPHLRVSDFVAWGIACEADNDWNAADTAYRRAWYGSRCSSNDALVRRFLLEEKRGDRAAMRQTLDEAARAGKVDPELLRYLEARGNPPIPKRRREPLKIQMDQSRMDRQTDAVRRI